MAKNDLQGLYDKYRAAKTDGTPVDKDAVYLVLRLDKGGYLDACQKAAAAFAAAVADENSRLAVDLDIVLWELGYRHDDPVEAAKTKRLVVGHRDGY